MWEDKFKTDFDDENSNNEADVGFDVNLSDQIKDGGKEYGDRNPGVVHGLSAGCFKDG